MTRKLIKGEDNTSNYGAVSSKLSDVGSRFNSGRTPKERNLTLKPIIKEVKVALPVKKKI